MLGLRVSVAPMLLSTSYTGPGAVDTGVPSRADVPNFTIGLFCLSMMAVPCASYCERKRESDTQTRKFDKTVRVFTQPHVSLKLRHTLLSPQMFNR